MDDEEYVRHKFDLNGTPINPYSIKLHRLDNYGHRYGSDEYSYGDNYDYYYETHDNEFYDTDDD